MRRKGLVLAGLIVLLVGIGFVYVSNQKPAPSNPTSTEDRRPKLKELVTRQEQESAQAVAAYLPKNKTRVDDLDSQVAELLRHLPGVVEVEVAVAVAAEKPTCRIVHLRDWHQVPKDLYAIDMKQAHGRELTDEEIDRLHQELLLEVEAIQLEQIALLRCLIRHHSLKTLFSEGLTEKDYANFVEIVGVLGKMERNQVGPLRKEVAGLREVLATMDPESESHFKVKKIEAEMSDMIEQHDLRLLEYGVAGRLLAAKEVEQVFPLDDADLLERAKPITPSGVKLDRERVAAREDAQVKAVMAKGGFGLIVLGGSHDLSDSVRRLGQGRCEYIRVTTKRFKEFAE
jgi:hypothetical protein